MPRQGGLKVPAPRLREEMDEAINNLNKKVETVIGEANSNLEEVTAKLGRVASGIELLLDSEEEIDV